MLDSLAAWLADSSVAYAMAPSGGGGGSPSFLIQLAPFLMIFAIIYFIMIRPQQKKQQEIRRMQEALKPEIMWSLAGFWVKWRESKTIL